MERSDKYWVVIPAAGAGKRFGADVPKQYLTINGRYILDHTIELFLNISEVEKIVIAIAEDDQYWHQSHYAEHECVDTTMGGKERFNSVLNGLNYLDTYADENDWVLIHDAARPCLLNSDIKKMILKLKDHDVGGLLALPVRDTMKRSDENGNVNETVERNNLWHALTPQMFRLSVLKNALEELIKSDIDVTDESQAIEKMGLNPLLVAGDPGNIKITHKDDLNIAVQFINNKTGTSI
jgi:2-C-methyl-D-erythritol 4-phosphate cytidylyltransferase